jgi:anti-anti-sigma regulatory factor
MARVSLSEFGTSFATRGRGQELREEILTRAGSGDSVVIDLHNVKHISHSFADELFAKLSADTGVAVEILGANPTVKHTVDEAVRRRAAVLSSR